MYLELHHSGTLSLAGSVHKRIDSVFDPFDLEARAGLALDTSPARFVFAVSLFRVEAIWLRYQRAIYLGGADPEFCDELNFPLFNSLISDISTVVVGDTIGTSFEEAEDWAEQELKKPYNAFAVVLDTKGVCAAWWQYDDEPRLVARAARSQNRLRTT